MSGHGDFERAAAAAKLASSKYTARVDDLLADQPWLPGLSEWAANAMDLQLEFRAACVDAFGYLPLCAEVADLREEVGHARLEACVAELVEMLDNVGFAGLGLELGR